MMRIVWHEGQWEVRKDNHVLRSFATVLDAWRYKENQEHSLFWKLLRRKA